MRELTAKQERVLDVIRREIGDTGLPPTVREIAREIGVNSSCTTQRHLDALERKGFIRRNRYKYRSIELISRDSTPLPQTKSQLIQRVRELEIENAILRGEVRR